MVRISLDQLRIDSKSFVNRPCFYAFFALIFKNSSQKKFNLDMKGISKRMDLNVGRGWLLRIFTFLKKTKNFNYSKNSNVFG